MRLNLFFAILCVFFTVDPSHVWSKEHLVSEKNNTTTESEPVKADQDQKDYATNWMFNKSLFVDAMLQAGYGHFKDPYLGGGVEATLGAKLFKKTYVTVSYALNSWKDILSMGSGGSSTITESELLGGFRWFFKSKTFLKDANGDILRNGSGKKILVNVKGATYLGIEGGVMKANQNMTIDSQKNTENAPMMVYKIGRGFPFGKTYFAYGLRAAFIFGNEFYNTETLQLSLTF
jgi:hypothetical protein